MLSRLTPRTRVTVALMALVTLGFALLLVGHATKAPADFNDNTNCWGKIEKGTPDPDDPSAVAVKYTIQCDGKITGYSLATAPERQVTGVDTEVFVTNGSGDIVPTDSFSCNGTFPGYGVNCVSPAGGDYKTPGNFIVGQFYVDKALCKESRLDPILTVAYATGNAKLQGLQSMAGPFDLGQDATCPKPTSWKKHTKRKIPAETDTVLTGQEERRRG
jgi:hypothetical protein